MQGKGKATQRWKHTWNIDEILELCRIEEYVRGKQSGKPQWSLLLDCEGNIDTILLTAKSSNFLYSWLHFFHM